MLFFNEISQLFIRKTGLSRSVPGFLKTVLIKIRNQINIVKPHVVYDTRVMLRYAKESCVPILKKDV